MNFVFPKVLLLLWLFPLIPGILFWRRKKRRERLLRFGQSSSVFVKTQKEWIFPLQLAMCTAGMLLMLAAAARPQWGMREETLTSSSRNVLLLLDVSRSMLATDVYPDRLSRAKEDLLELAEKLEWDRAALMVFRARTTLLCPFTTDTNFLKQTIADTVIEMAPAGETDIGGALADALRTFDSFGSDSNSILLLSDGEDLSTHAEEMAKECAARNIPVFCIGVGHRSGAAIPISETQTLTYQGKEVISKLNPEALMEIARLSGGFYLPIESTFEQSLGTIYRERVRDRMKQETHERIEQRYIERYALFLIPGLLLLVFAALFSKGRPAKRARRTGAKSSLAALFFAGFSLFAPALSAQTAPEVSRPDPQQQKLDFNAGLVALQEKNYGQAAALFEKSGRREALAGIGVARYYAALENAEKKLSSCTNLTQRASCTREKLEGLRAAAMALRADAMARAEESSGTESDPKSQYAVNLSLVLEELQKTVRQYEEEKKQLLIDGKDLLEQLKFLLKEQRAVHQNVSDAEVGKITERLPLLEGAAARQENVVFLWEHVLKQLQGTITNQTEAAVFDKNVAPFLEKAAQARLTLEENPLKSALPALETASLGALHLYGVAAPPLDALDFAITSQSNALVRTAAPQQILTPVREQQNAAFLFSVFAEKYHAAAPAQDFISTNDVSAAEVPPEVPGEEDIRDGKAAQEAVKKEVERLISETEGTMRLLLMGLMPQEDSILPEKKLPDARQALKNMEEIQKLLTPPPPPQSQNQQNQSAENQQQESQESDSQNQSQPPPEQSAQENAAQQDASETEQENAEEPQTEEEDADAAEEKPEDSAAEQEAQTAEATEEESEEDFSQRIMQAILDQEKKRKEEYRKYHPSSRPSPSARDW